MVLGALIDSMTSGFRSGRRIPVHLRCVLLFETLGGASIGGSAVTARVLVQAEKRDAVDDAAAGVGTTGLLYAAISGIPTITGPVSTLGQPDDDDAESGVTSGIMTIPRTSTRRSVAGLLRSADDAASSRLEGPARDATPHDADHAIRRRPCTARHLHRRSAMGDLRSSDGGVVTAKV